MTQTGNCAKIIWVTMAQGMAVDARVRKTYINVPTTLPLPLKQIFAEAIACFETGNVIGCRG